MHQEPNPGRKRRETIVALALVILLGGLLVFFLNLISMGIFLYVGAAIVLMTLVGFLHYVLWGQTLTENTAGEREEADLKAKMEEDWEGREEP